MPGKSDIMVVLSCYIYKRNLSISEMSHDLAMSQPMMKVEGYQGVTSQMVCKGAED
jgi:hypothetical protein